MNAGQWNDGNDPDEVVGEQLRQVLTDAAGSVNPADGSLGRVLTRAHQRSVWSWGTPVLAAAAAVLLVAGAGVYAGTRSHDTALPGAPSASTSGLPSGPSASATDSSAHSSPTTPAGTLHALPVYYAAEFNGQALLYREFHPVRTAEPAQAAIRETLGVKPVDPDYESLWPSRTTLRSYTRSGSVADVVLSDAPSRFSTSAFQQIVYTVTAADPTVHSVRISYPTVTLDPISRAASIDALAPVWLLAPSQGATASSPVTLSGQAMVFEAQVNWEVDTPDGVKVAAGSAMTPEAFVMGPWSSKVTLPPGHYVAKAFEVSAKDGLWTWVDTKDFTVR